MTLVLGLGNPGRRYILTRHNAGWRVVRTLVGRWKAGAGEETPEYRSWKAEAAGHAVDLAIPLTQMNRSGDALEAWRQRRPFDPVSLLVVADDVYLALGTLRLRAGGSSGGHRGLQSIEAALGSREYARLRVGVGAAESAALREHVLGEPPADERAVMDEAIGRAADAVECWLGEGVFAAMNRFNRRMHKEDSES